MSENGHPRSDPGSHSRSCRPPYTERTPHCSNEIRHAIPEGLEERRHARIVPKRRELVISTEYSGSIATRSCRERNTGPLSHPRRYGSKVASVRRVLARTQRLERVLFLFRSARRRKQLGRICSRRDGTIAFLLSRHDFESGHIQLNDQDALLAAPSPRKLSGAHSPSATEQYSFLWDTLSSRAEDQGWERIRIVPPFEASSDRALRK